ncbi:hypothetical protein D3C75_587870 [compost metagenome]
MEELWRRNGKLTNIKMPGLEMASNGARYPSCSIMFNIPNPYWDDALPFAAQQPSWFVSFSYKKGKWDHRMHTYGRKKLVVTEQQMILDRVRATREEL